jgi:hypothetical protein
VFAVRRNKADGRKRKNNGCEEEKEEKTDSCAVDSERASRGVVLEYHKPVLLWDRSAVWSLRSPGAILSDLTGYFLQNVLFVAADSRTFISVILWGLFAEL